MTRSACADLAEGAHRFDAGQHWAAHEAWELAWRIEAPGPRRDYLQGLIQLAAVCHHLRRGKAFAARSVLDRARARLRAGATRAQPWSVARLLAVCDQLAEVLDAGLLPPVPALHLSQAFAPARD